MKRSISLVVLLSVLPIMGLIKTDASWLWLLSSLFVSSCILLINVVFQQRRYRVPVTLLSVITIQTINSAYFFSFLLQNEGFNAAFLYHLRPDVMFGAVSDYLYLIVAEIFHWILLVITAVIVSRRVHANEFLLRHKSAVVLTTLLSLCLWTPVLSIYNYLTDYVFENTVDNSSAGLILDKVESNDFSAKTNGKPNVVFIYLEGVERSYFNLPGVDNLMPELTKIRDNSVDFSNIQQVEGTGFTIGGLVASQCGYPLVSPYESTDHNDIAPTQEFMKEAHCLGDVLADEGYTLSFLGGADMRFAGKDKFFSTHGFQNVKGKTELKDKLENKKYMQGWGLYDDSLFDFVWSQYETLSEKSDPFLLSTLTVDTHPPYGTKSKSCDQYQGSDNRMLVAVNCTDQLVSKFIKKIRASKNSENTIIVVMSDHLAMVNEAWDFIKKYKEERTLTYFVNFHDGRNDVIDNVGTHFDVSPTLLDLMDFDLSGQYAFGQSLLKGDGFLADNAESLDVIKNTKLQQHVASLWQTNAVELNESGIELVKDNTNNKNGHFLKIGGSEYNLKSLAVFDTAETFIKLNDKYEITDYQSYPLGYQSGLKDNGLTGKVMADPYANYILIGRNKYLGGLIDYDEPEKLSIFIGSPSSSKFYSADIDKKSLSISFDLVNDIFSSPKTEKMFHIRKFSQYPLKELLREVKLESWFLDNKNSLTVRACGFGACTAEIIDNQEDVSSIKRGLEVYALDENLNARFISRHDYCAVKSTYKESRPLSEVIRNEKEKSKFLLFSSFDSIHCRSKAEGGMRDLDKWIGDLDLPILEKIKFRQPYIALINLETSEVVEVKPLEGIGKGMELVIDAEQLSVFSH